MTTAIKTTMTAKEIKEVISNNTWYAQHGSNKIEVPNTAVLNLYEGCKLNGLCTKKYGFYAIKTTNGAYAIKIAGELHTTSK